jgi:uncharacterized protein YcbX
MHIAEIWRYPVKSLAGERLRSAALTTAGISGDRLVQVRGLHDRVLSARRYPSLLGLRGRLAEDGEPTIDGRPWRSPEVLDQIRGIAGPQAHLERDDDPEVRFDVLPLLVATDGAIAAFGDDGRRLRPNIVIGGVNGLDERSWPGAELTIGEVVIAVRQLRTRCVMTTLNPDTLDQDHSILRRIVDRFDGDLSLDCAIVRGGTIQEGQTVALQCPGGAVLSHHRPAGISRL